jgi:hypothetical protein
MSRATAGISNHFKMQLFGGGSLFGGSSGGGSISADVGGEAVSCIASHFDGLLHLMESCSPKKACRFFMKSGALSRGCCSTALVSHQGAS